ncbi:MAG: glucose-6-phosphate isomerase [Pseudomonadota bacterium]
MASPLTDSPRHGELQSQAAALATTSVTELFAADADRCRDFTASAAGLTLDYAKQLLNRQVRDDLLRLAEQADLPGRAKALLGGEEVNNTERRPALHSLLRAIDAPPGLEDELADVELTRQRMREIAGAINAGEFKGFSGEVITDVVNIGIGGSDLGPRLVCEALRPYWGGVTCHYIANVDPADLQNCLLGLNPAATLFIVCSKSFRTEETLANSLAARDWMRHAGAQDADLDRHFLAITTNLGAAAEFGIPAENCLPMWDWVGGRYSVWSAIGLSVACAVGWERFSQFLGGAEAMDRHFASAEPAANLPMLLSLLEVWNSNYLGADNHAVLPYDQALAKLPDFLQQLTMESNGKGVLLDGSAATCGTGPVLWGSAGTMGQHSFHQLLHQGTRRCPVDFILPLTTHTGMHQQHRRLVANCLAQARTLMVGRSLGEAEASLLARGLEASEAERLAPHLAMPGSRPNSTITMEALTPATLGALLALYEHRTFCSSVLWGINAFDQWGVELGKDIGVEILGLMESGKDTAMDASTAALLKAWRELN